MKHPRRLCTAVFAAAFALTPGVRVAAAQPPPGSSIGRQPAARTRVVVAPLATLGAESSSAEVRAAQRLVARGLASLGSVELVGHAAMLAAVKRAGRPALRACDGDPACLADLGRLVRATYAIYGEVGGLGGAQVVYLKLVDAAARREVRTTVLELSGRPSARADAEARAAATRLLTPTRYIGRVELDTNVAGASIFVDGRLVARSPARPLIMAVGAHALRVTHPEYRDFVRFVEVEFAATTRIPVDLRPYGDVEGDIRRTRRDPPVPLGRERDPESTPWYGRWYAIAGGGALLLVTSAVVVGLLSGGLSFDLEKDL